MVKLTLSFMICLKFNFLCFFCIHFNCIQRLLLFQKLTVNWIMAFRRPPSNVESMVSLRVDNLPYRAVGEVNSKGTNNFIIDICTSGFKASLWQIWRGWRYLSSNRERNWKISRICVREILRPKRRGGSFMGRLRDSLKSETDFLENGSYQLTDYANQGISWENVEVLRMEWVLRSVIILLALLLSTTNTAQILIIAGQDIPWPRESRHQISSVPE